MNIVCFGDSVTAGTNFADGDRWTTVLHHRLDQARPGAFAVYNRGVGGSTIVQGFDRFEPTVLPLLPAILLVQFGYNDAHTPAWTQLPRVGIPEFTSRLEELVRIAGARGGQAVLVLNHEPLGHVLPQGNGRTYEQNFAAFDDATRQLAARLGTPSIDLPALFAAAGFSQDNYLADDRIHLTPAGNHLYARMIHEGLQALSLV